MKLNVVKKIYDLLKTFYLVMYNRQNEMSKISKRNVQKKEKRPSWLSRFFDSFFNLSSYKIWVEYNRQNQKCKKN